MEKTSPDCARVQLDLLKRFPLLVPTSADYSHYEGYLEVNGTLFRTSLVVPQYPSAKDVALNCEWKLSELLRNHRNTLAEWSQTGKPFVSFLEDLHSLITECLQNDGGSRLSLEKDTVAFEEQVDYLQRYSAILVELKELGTSNLQSISSDFGSVCLSSLDKNGDAHLLNLKMAHDENQVTFGKHCFNVVDTDLPDKIIKMIQKEISVTRAYKTFSEQIGILDVIWDSLTLIDKKCWVIDPVHPRKADMYRRIYITPCVMAQISWDPLKPNHPPEIKFQGADTEIDALRATYEEHLEDWDQESSILDNLCSVLKLASLPEAPPPETSAVSQTVETGECSICYTVQFEGKLPEESCGKCLSGFHTACLYEWLEMVPGSRQVHGHISGPCPNCESVMKCPCPHAVA